MDARTTQPSGTVPDNPVFRRAATQVTVLVAYYRVGTPSTSAFSRIFRKNTAGGLSWGLQIASSGHPDNPDFVISTTTASNQSLAAGFISGDRWSIIVGRWTSGVSRTITWFNSDGTIAAGPAAGTNLGGTLIYDGSPLYFARVPFYYGFAYAFDTNLSDSVIRQILRDPWGLVRPSQAPSALGMTPTTGGASAGGSRVMGMLG
jgi:hypothetical protein